MATASIESTTTKVPVTTYKDVTTVTGVTLNLSLAEAQALRAVLGRISSAGALGGPDTTIRKFTDPIYFSLGKVGFGGGPDVPVFKENPVAVTLDLTKFGV